MYSGNCISGFQLSVAKFAKMPLLLPQCLPICKGALQRISSKKVVILIFHYLSIFSAIKKLCHIFEINKLSKLNYNITKIIEDIVKRFSRNLYEICTNTKFLAIKSKYSRILHKPTNQNKRYIITNLISSGSTYSRYWKEYKKQIGCPKKDIICLFVFQLQTKI